MAREGNAGVLNWAVGSGRRPISHWRAQLMGNQSFTIRSNNQSLTIGSRIDNVVVAGSLANQSASSLRAGQIPGDSTSRQGRGRFF